MAEAAPRGSSRGLKWAGVAAGLVFVAAGGHFHWHRHQLVRGGHTAIVEPIANYKMQRSKGMTTYTAEFHWTLMSSGRPVQKRTSFPEAVLEDFKAGRDVRIYYDPNDPGDLVFENDKPGWWMIAGGAAFALAALVML